MDRMRFLALVAVTVAGLLWQALSGNVAAADVVPATAGAPEAPVQPVYKRPDRIEYFGEDGKFHWHELSRTVEIETWLPHLKASAGTPVRQDMTSFGPGWGAASS
jgi:hypothetical protein